jgi:hypothetical protein
MMNNFNRWTSELPEFPGVYHWRRPHIGKEWSKGTIMVDSNGNEYDLALGLLRRFHLSDPHDSETQYFLVRRSGDEPIILDKSKCYILDRRKK